MPKFLYVVAVVASYFAQRRTEEHCHTTEDECRMYSTSDSNGHMFSVNKGAGFTVVYDWSTHETHTFPNK